LSFYDTTLQEDTEILESDDQNKLLTSNERNCVLYRHGEKVILNFLIDSSTKILKLLSLSQKEAKKEVSKYKNFDRCMDYVRNVIYPLIEYGK
jgi:hypothetical protein